MNHDKKMNDSLVLPTPKDTVCPGVRDGAGIGVRGILGVGVGVGFAVGDILAVGSGVAATPVGDAMIRGGGVRKGRGVEAIEERSGTGVGEPVGLAPGVGLAPATDWTGLGELVAL